MKPLLLATPARPPTLNLKFIGGAALHEATFSATIFAGAIFVATVVAIISHNLGSPIIVVKQRIHAPPVTPTSNPSPGQELDSGEEQKQELLVAQQRLQRELETIAEKVGEARLGRKPRVGETVPTTVAVSALPKETKFRLQNYFSWLSAVGVFEFENELYLVDDRGKILSVMPAALGYDRFGEPESERTVSHPQATSPSSASGPWPPITTLQFESEPAGAEVKTSTGQSCKTPCALAVPATDLMATYALKGFKPQTVRVNLVLPMDTRPDAEGSTTPALPTFSPSPVYAELERAGPERRQLAPRQQKPASALTGEAAPSPAAQARQPAPPPPSANSPWPPAPNQPTQVR